MHHIVILVHKRDRFEKINYCLYGIAEYWREKGLQVSISYGCDSYVEADLAVLHVDLTEIPEDYLAFIHQYPVVINGKVSDISKRVISSNLIHPGDDYTGKVIVKTNLNCGGAPERKIMKRAPGLRKYVDRLRRALPWRFGAETRYRIFPSVEQVPRFVWHNPDLIVEKFVPECHDGLYCLRTWVFLGDKETNSLSYSHQPIIKSGNVIRREIVADIPDEIRQMRKDLGFDFGKFDYAVVDGRVILYDANRTPTLGQFTKEQYLSSIHLLAEGIHGYL